MSTQAQPPVANAVENELTTDISTSQKPSDSSIDISKELLKVRLKSQNPLPRAGSHNPRLHLRHQEEDRHAGRRTL